MGSVYKQIWDTSIYQRAPEKVFSATQFCLVQQKEARVISKLIYVVFEMPNLPRPNHSCIEQTQSSVFMG